MYTKIKWVHLSFLWQAEMSAPLSFADEIGGVAADFVAVEDVEHAELLDGGVAELAEREVDPFFAVALGELAPAGAGRGGTEKGDVGAGAVAAGGGEEAFFERFGEVEGAVAPDVGNVNGRKEEHRAAVG